MSLLQRIFGLLPWSRRPTQVLIVCAQSPCRSSWLQAVADGLTRSLARKHAGVKDLNLRFAPARVRASTLTEDPVLNRYLHRRGYRLRRTRVRQVTPETIATSQVVLATDRSTLRSLQRRCTSPHAHKLHLVLDFVPGRGGQDLPLCAGDGDCAETLELCERAFAGLAKALLAQAERPAMRTLHPGAPANMGYH